MSVSLLLGRWKKMEQNLHSFIDRLWREVKIYEKKVIINKDASSSAPTIPLAGWPTLVINKTPQLK